jgi:hypothetical protein
MNILIYDQWELDSTRGKRRYKISSSKEISKYFNEERPIEYKLQKAGRCEEAWGGHVV